MADWASQTSDLLWRNGLTAIPLVLLTAGVCRCIPCRPATRHTMWLLVLAWLATPTLLPSPPTPHLVSARETPVLPSDVDPTKGEALSEPEASGSGQWVASTPKGVGAEGPALVLGALNEKTVRPSPRKPTKKTGLDQNAVRINQLEEPPKVGSIHAQLAPISSPLPSPRLAARTASRSPDVLAQATGAVGSPSDASTAVEATKIPGKDRDVDFKAAAPTVEVAPFGGTLDDFKHDPLLVQVEGHEAPALSPISSSPDWWMWAAGLLAVRDSITALPPLPTTVWVAGTALLLIVAALRILRFRRRLSLALPAPSSVMSVVAAACQQIGLRRVPETLMVDGRLSPMIWCGLRPRLILPVPLWSQLDGPGRRAVIFHELAHVRRWDHWVSWLDQMIGSLYWWHPLVWWARRRLHAEAEVCCDAWVTSLLPRTRRAYAEALLATRQYVADENRPVPALGIGVTTGRARRFARRLTMVMTESVKPRLSASGLAMVLMMATTGWLASPAQSCPEEDEAVKATSKGCDKPCATPCASGKATTATAPTPAATAGGVSTYEQHMAHRNDATAVTADGGVVVSQGQPIAATLKGVGAAVAPFALASGRGGGQEERLDRLEEELERLGEQLERLAEALGDQNDAHGPGERTPRPPRAARVPRTPQPGQPAMAPMPAMPPMAPMPPMPAQPPMAPGVGFGSGLGEGHDGGEVFPRVYTLPNGKLEPLTQLMSRSDVPLLIRAQENGIEVNATEGQHRVFAAFVRMIHPSGDRSGARVAPGVDGYRRAAVDRKRMAKDMERAAKQRAKSIERMEKRRAKTGARMEQIKIEATVKSETQEALEREAENLNDEAERLAEQAADFRERTEHLEERAGRESERDKRADLERELLTLRHQTEALELQKSQLEDQARTVEDRAHEAEDQAREAENRLEQFEEELRQAEEEAGEENEDGSHASVGDSGSEWWNSLQPAIEAAMDSITGQSADDGEDSEESIESESDDD